MAGKKSEKRKYSHSQQLLDKRFGLLLMVPITVMMFGIAEVPFMRTLYLNFANKVIGISEQFIRFDNYLTLFRDKIYQKSLYNTTIHTVGYIMTKLALGPLLAVILNQKFRRRTSFKTALLAPQALPGVVTVTTWRWMHDSTYGIINNLLLKAGLISPPIPRLSNLDITLLSTMIMNVQRGMSLFVFSLLGALQTLDGQTFEAAYVDGAGMFKHFWHITLPGISSALGIPTLLSTIWTLNDFENIFLIIGGGPIYSSSVVSTHTYDLAFTQSSLSGVLSAAVSVIPLMLILILVSQKVIDEDRNEWGRRWTGW